MHGVVMEGQRILSFMWSVGLSPPTSCGVMCCVSTVGNISNTQLNIHFIIRDNESVTSSSQQQQQLPPPRPSSDKWQDTEFRSALVTALPRKFCRGLQTFAQINDGVACLPCPPPWSPVQCHVTSDMSGVSCRGDRRTGTVEPVQN